VAAYCDIEEVEIRKQGVHTIRPKKRVVIKREEETKSPQEIALEEAMLSAYKDNRPKICFVCLRNDGAPFEERIHEFINQSSAIFHPGKSLLQITFGFLPLTYMRAIPIIVSFSSP
jgi:hypothetical protein